MAIQNTGSFQTIDSGFTSAIGKKEILTAGTPLSVLDPNPNREYVSLVLTTAGSVTVLFGSVASGLVGEGIVLTGKGSNYEITKNNPYKGEISAISDDDVELSILEGQKD